MRAVKVGAAAAVVAAGAVVVAVGSSSGSAEPGRPGPTAQAVTHQTIAKRRLARWPSPASTGVPRGWTPKRTRSEDLRVTKPGSIVSDVLLRDADLIVDAPNVTIRRVKLQGGRITNHAGPRCQGPMRIEDTTLEPAPGRRDSVESEGVIDASSYTARRVKIWRRSEGFRLTGNGFPGCGPSLIQDSFAKIVIPQGRCDLHADGIQGYGGPPVTVSNVTIDFNEATCGTAPFFVPKDQDNRSVAIDRLLVMGGGYPFRLGVPGSVTNLKIVNRSWEFGPIDVACSLVSKWDAKIVTITKSYQVKRTVRRQRCNTESGT